MSQTTEPVDILNLHSQAADWITKKAASLLRRGHDLPTEPDKVLLGENEVLVALAGDKAIYVSSPYSNRVEALRRLRLFWGFLPCEWEEIAQKDRRFRQQVPCPVSV